MPAKRIYKSSLSALIASCLAFAAEPSFGQENEAPEPVKVKKRNTASPQKAPAKASASVENQGERVSLSKATKPTSPRIKKSNDSSVVPASSLDDNAPLQVPSDESAVVNEEPFPMASQEEWSYPSAYESVGAGYAGQGAPGTQVYIDTGILGSILSRTKVRIEGATFWGSGHTLQPLVTTRRPANSTTTDGRLDQVDTIALFGRSEVLDGTAPGVRISADLSLDAFNRQGILFRMFQASEIDNGYTNAGSTEAVVVRPFFDTASQATIVINHPGNADLTGRRQGTVDASITSDVAGGDLLLRTTLGRERSGAIDFLMGYQHVRLDESLLVSSSSTVLSTNETIPVGTVSELQDQFRTTNRFHGFALGLDSTFREGRWSFNSLFKLGMGNIEREIDINGFSRITVPGAPASVTESTNGLLARNTNNGSYRSDRFVVSPEVALTLGYRFSRRLDATLTYTYLGLPSVARAGEQLDPNLAVNLSNPPTGAVAPRFAEVNSNYSLHSLSYGIQWRY